MRLLLVGYGRMARLVEALAGEQGCTVSGRVTSATRDELTADRLRDVDVAVDFSTAAAFVENFPRLAAGGVSVVVGTTGWQADEARLRAIADDRGIGVVAASNFSPGLHRFRTIVAEAARLFAETDYGAWIHEAHHVKKRDAPSGTALTLREAMTKAGYARPIDVSSTRAGAIPGTHTVGFDAASETITLTHTVRDRATFARGALEAARWIKGRRGWFGFEDVLGLRQ